jgi:hypothetical protein
MAEKKTTSEVSTEYLETIFKLMSEHGIESLSVGEIKVVKSPYLAPIAPKIDKEEPVDDDPLLSAPTTPEELDLALTNLGKMNG